MTRSAGRKKYSPGEWCQIGLLRLQQVRTPTEADQNVLVNMIASNTGSWLVSFRIFMHVELVTLLKNFLGCSKPQKFYATKFDAKYFITKIAPFPVVPRHDIHNYAQKLLYFPYPKFKLEWFSGSCTYMYSCRCKQTISPVMYLRLSCTPMHCRMILNLEEIKLCVFCLDFQAPN